MITKIEEGSMIYIGDVRPFIIINKEQKRIITTASGQSINNYITKIEKQWNNKEVEINYEYN